jgi:hypothetical protein
MSASATAFAESGHEREGAMEIKRRQFLQLAAGAAVLPAMSRIARRRLIRRSRRESSPTLLLA